VLAAALMLGMAALYYHKPARFGLQQPIPFSHRVHAGDKQISCYFCHTEGPGGAQSGVPPLETCMLCHSRIIVQHPSIVALREHYTSGVPVEWLRVNDVPDFVFFDHSVHLGKGLDCGECHGAVNAMDRVVLAHDLNMGFCVQCHRDQGASHDCFVCHR
jgi:predicted CXXCH cytochrome family protein